MEHRGFAAQHSEGTRGTILSDLALFAQGQL